MFLNLCVLTVPYSFAGWLLFGYVDLYWTYLFNIITLESLSPLKIAISFFLIRFFEFLCVSSLLDKMFFEKISVYPHKTHRSFAIVADQLA